MTGLERIEKEIVEEAESQAAKRIQMAEEKAGEIRRKLREEAEETEQGILEKGRREAADWEERMSSLRESEGRRILLEARQRVLEELMEKAEAKLQKTETGQYFSMLEKMLERAVLAGTGNMFLSREDLDRMPRDFPERVKRIARAAGGTLELVGREGEGTAGESGEAPPGKGMPAQQGDGFVLVYGRIEVNCTLKAVLECRREQIRDALGRYLWRDLYE